VTWPGDCSLLRVQILTVIAVYLVERFTVFGIRLLEFHSEPWIRKSLAVYSPADRVVLEVGVSVHSPSIEGREELIDFLTLAVVDNIECVTLFVYFARQFWNIKLSLVVYSGLDLRTMGVLRLIHAIVFVSTNLQRRSNQVRLNLTILSSFRVENL